MLTLPFADTDMDNAQVWQYVGTREGSRHPTIEEGWSSNFDVIGWLRLTATHHGAALGRNLT
jgi:hypothetical protein